MTFGNKSVGNNTQYFPHLEQEKISFYPNGFININQNGEYTKHYYAETQRIASKIGAGSHHNLCEEFKALYVIQAHELDMLQYEAEDKIQQDLTFLVDPEAWVDIEYAYSDICNLKGGDSTGYESKLFFYHGNHLSSTQMITDINAKVVQQVLYAPFGEVITEHNAYWHNGLLPDYMFNAKELDEESGMYYYEARYYAPPTFISRDPHFESYPTMSPYAYCANNPVKYIDPTGKDGVVVVDGENKTVTVKVNIILYSKSRYVGKDILDKAAKDYKQNIMDNWSKDANGDAWTTEHNGETYTINFDVNVSVNTQAAHEKNRDYNGMNNYVEIVGSSGYRSNVKGNNHDGTWARTTSSDNAGAHEFGHMLGLKDRYTDEKNVGSIPHKGWEGNIMGSSEGRVEQRNIDGIYNSVRQNINNTKGMKLLFSGYMFFLNSKNKER
jgi:RHS repeat-associated protein